MSKSRFKRKKDQRFGEFRWSGVSNSATNTQQLVCVHRNIKLGEWMPGWQTFFPTASIQHIRISLLLRHSVLVDWISLLSRVLERIRLWGGSLELVKNLRAHAITRTSLLSDEIFDHNELAGGGGVPVQDWDLCSLKMAIELEGVLARAILPTTKKMKWVL